MKFPFARLYTVASVQDDRKVSKISSVVMELFKPSEGRHSSSGGFEIDFSKTANIFSAIPSRICQMVSETI